MELPENYSSREFESASEIILQWDTTESGGGGGGTSKGHIFECDRGEIDLYLQAVDGIGRSTRLANADNNLSRANKTMQIAVVRLKEEFRNILISNPDFLAHWSSLQDDVFDSYDGFSSLGTVYELQDDPAINISKEPIYDLRSISERMSTVGYIGDCIQVYVDVRKSYMDACFQRLCIEKLSPGEIKRLDRDTLFANIRSWIQAAKFCVRMLFAREKQLCEHIFQGLGSTVDDDDDDECFTRTVEYHAILLFNFAESVALIRPSPEKLFKALDLCNTLSDLLPEIDVIFKSKSLECIRILATETLSGLANATREILTKFENDVLRELSEIPVPGGSIHPLARYVMKYINLLVTDYKQNLIELVISMPSPSLTLTCSGDMNTFPDMGLVKLAEQTPLAFHLSWIIVVLLFNLEGKSKHYEDDSLAHLFMMNNIHYIVQTINNTAELPEIVGERFVEKLKEKVQLAMVDCEMSTWNKILLPLELVPPNTDWPFLFGWDTSIVVLKRFNAMFDRARETQEQWVVPDLQLLQELRLTILKRLIPAYKSVLDKLDVHRSTGNFILHKMDVMRRKNLQKHIKYSVEDIENAILDFFKGV